MVVILNDLCPELDEEWNGEFYDKETRKTGVIYMIWNVWENKAYIGRAKSFTIYEIRHGAKGRFRIHWTNKSSSNEKNRNDCRVFYEALRNSNINDWFVFTLDVCLLDELKDRETDLIKKYNTSNPKFGYNYFVGNNKPNNPEHLKTYQSQKASTNTKRAINGKMKRTDKNKKLPTYISYYPVKKGDELLCEGYMARITLNGEIYKKVFISMEDSMEEKLEKALAYIESIKIDVRHDELQKGQGRKIEKSQNLPQNIRYYTMKKNGEIICEGYCVEMKINNEKHKTVFTSKHESMESKLHKAIQAKKQFELLRKKSLKKKTSGSKTAKKNH